MTLAGPVFVDFAMSHAVERDFNADRAEIDVVDPRGDDDDSCTSMKQVGGDKPGYDPTAAAALDLDPPADQIRK